MPGSALAGAWISYGYVYGDAEQRINPDAEYDVSGPFSILFNNKLFWIAAGTFVAALISAFIFTWVKSRKEDPCLGQHGQEAHDQCEHTLLVGAVFLVQLIEYGNPALVAPGASFSTDWPC